MAAAGSLVNSAAATKVVWIWDEGVAATGSRVPIGIGCRGRIQAPATEEKGHQERSSNGEKLVG